MSYQAFPFTTKFEYKQGQFAKIKINVKAKICAYQFYSLAFKPGNADLRNENNELMGHQYAGQTLHWGPFWSHNQYELTGGHM